MMRSAASDECEQSFVGTPFSLGGMVVGRIIHIDLSEGSGFKGTF